MAHCFGEMELEWLVGATRRWWPSPSPSCLYVHLSLYLLLLRGSLHQSFFQFLC